MKINFSESNKIASLTVTKTGIKVIVSDVDEDGHLDGPEAIEWETDRPWNEMRPEEKTGELESLIAKHRPQKQKPNQIMKTFRLSTNNESWIAEAPSARLCVEAELKILGGIEGAPVTVYAREVDANNDDVEDGECYSATEGATRN